MTLIFIDYLKYKDLKQTFERYDIQNIILSEDAYAYIDTLLDNLLANEEESIAIVANCKYFDVFNSLVFLLLKIDSSNNEEISSKIYKVFLKYEFYKGKHTFFTSDSGIDLFELLSLFMTKNKPNREIAVKLLMPVFHREKTWWKPDSYVKSIADILSKEDFILEDIQDISQINYSPNSDWYYLSALYPILSIKLREQVLEYLQNVELYFDCHILARVYHVYGIPVFNIAVYERYKSNIIGMELYYSNLLIKVRNDERCSSVHEKIDEFIAESEYMKFASNPIAYKEIDNIEPDWLLYCEAEDFKKLVSYEAINKKVKDLFAKGWVGDRLKEKFIKYA